jgi:hypothetical protein
MITEARRPGRIRQLNVGYPSRTVRHDGRTKTRLIKCRTSCATPPCYRCNTSIVSFEEAGFGLTPGFQGARLRRQGQIERGGPRNANALRRI